MHRRISRAIRGAVVSSLAVAVVATVIDEGTAGAAVASASAPAPGRAERVVVTLRPGSDTRFIAPRLLHGAGTVRHVYSRVLNGFAADVPAAAVAQLRRDPHVLSVVVDRIAHGATVQTSPPWGLDRIDQRARPVDGRYGYDTTGAGVTVYVIDSGIRFSHAEFGGRATSGYDFYDDDANAADCHGHGSSVASIAGGATYGVAKGVKFVSLRVWGCDNTGPFSDIVAALDWVVAHRSGPAVVNLSGGGGVFEPADQAVTRTVAAGIPVVVAAMNNGADACNSSPARAAAGITVGATDGNDARASFSNYGTCVDLFAPGTSIRSAENGSDAANSLWSGTSMAAPHVTGVVARYLQGHPTATPAAVASMLAGSATSGIVTDARSPHPDLLYAAAAGSPQGTRPGPATQVKAAQVKREGRAVLTWAPPADDGGTPITGFRVRRSGKDLSGKSDFLTDLPAGARSCTFDHLRLGTTYQLVVQAANAVGRGKETKVSLTPIGLPGAPKIGKASSGKSGGTITATATWSTPGSDGGSGITGYVVTALRLNGKGEVVQGVTSPLTKPGARKLEFKLPVAGTYQFLVQAVNKVGAGPQSARSGKVTAR